MVGIGLSMLQGGLMSEVLSFVAMMLAISFTLVKFVY